MFFSRASKVLAAGVIGALSSSVLVLSPAATAARAPERVTLQVGSYNIFAKVSPGVFDDAVKSVLPRVDVLGLQEVHGDEKGRELDKLRSWGWGHFRPELGYKNAILWKKARFQFISGRTEKFTKSRYVGAERPERATLNDNYATIVRLKDRTSHQRLSIVNVHLSPGAVSAGEPVRNRPRIFDAYVDQVRRMASVTRTEKAWGEVFVLGDFNVGWVADEKKRNRKLPFATFARMKMKASWATNRPADGGTRGDALLDQIYAPRKARAASVAFDIKHSDHYPALATYRLPVR